MSNIAAGIMALVLSAPYGLRPPENATTDTLITEQDVRTASARHYSELLRLACVNGWKFRRGDVVAGFNRHFEELRLVLVDRGATIIPLADEPKLEVTEIVFGSGEPSGNLNHRGCFRARWQKQMRKSFGAASEIRPVAN